MYETNYTYWTSINGLLIIHCGFFWEGVKSLNMSLTNVKIVKCCFKNILGETEPQSPFDYDLDGGLKTQLWNRFTDS